MDSRKMNRRKFLETSGKTLLTAGAAAQFSTIPHTVLGANDRIIVGVMGIGSRGTKNLKNFMSQQDVTVAAVCDVYKPRLQKAVEMTGGKTDAYHDFRKMLERNDIDVILNSTPTHWHGLSTILACEAGKDVYVEKPMTLYPWEGRKMVEFARKNKRIVQVGSQQRSGAHYQEAIEIIRSGGIGKIAMVKCWNFDNQYPEGIGNPPITDPPPDLDWEMWVGPAPMMPYCENRYRRYFWAYAGGMMTNWGSHHLDTIQAAMNETYPQAVQACGGKYYVRDNRETPDTLDVHFVYPGFICTFTDSVICGHGYDGQRIGMQFYGTKGTLLLRRGGYNITPETERVDGQVVELMSPVERKGTDSSKAHVRNFLDCVKSRNLPICDVEVGHESAIPCLLGNISYRTNRRIEWDPINEKITNCEEANKLLRPEYRALWKLPS